MQLGQNSLTTGLGVAHLVGSEAGDFRGGIGLEIPGQARGGELPQDPVEQPGRRRIIQPRLGQARDLDQVLTSQPRADITACFIQIGDSGFRHTHASDAMTA